MSVMIGSGGVRQIDPKLQKLRKEKQERKEGTALLRDMLKIKEERLEKMEKFTRHVQLSSLLDKLESNSNKRKNKSKSNNTKDGELKTRIRELEKENKQLRASEKSRAEKMKRVEAIYVATLRKKEDLEKDSVQLELVKCKLEGAEQKVAELTRRNERLEKENKKLLERRCQYCPKDNDILSSNVSLKSLASQTGLTEHVVGTLREEQSPGKNKRKAAMLKSVAEEKARQEEVAARNDDDRIMDEVLHSAQKEVHMELDNFGIKEEDDLRTEREEAFKNKIIEKILNDEDGKDDDASKRITSSGHSCHICGKSFSRTRNLQRHILVHSPDKPHKCDHCGKTFRRLDALKSHKLGTEKAGKCNASHHATRDTAAVKPVTAGKKSCNLCGKSFNQLRQHMYVHSRPFKCTDCGTRFSRRDALVTHQQGSGKCMTIGCLMKSTEKQVNATETEILSHKTHTVRGQSDADESPVRENMSEDDIKEETIVVNIHLEGDLDAGENDIVNTTVSPYISTSSTTDKKETPGATSSPVKHHPVKRSVTSGRILALPEGLNITEKNI